MDGLKKIRLLAMDVDGVLTKGQIIYGDHGNELKVFNVKDGLGLFQAAKIGLKTAIITGRSSEAVRRRAEELRITYCLQGISDKCKALQNITEELQIASEEVAYVGDDINDLSVMEWVGLPIAVGDAVEEVKKTAIYTCHRPGGEGAIREVVELILKAQNRWDAIVDSIKCGSKIQQ